MSETPESSEPRAEVGRYPRLAEARERGLVVAAKELPHWVERAGDDWILLVEEPARDEVLRELAVFEAEESQRPAMLDSAAPRQGSPISLFAVAWVLSGFFFAQQVAPDFWETRGVADSRAILAGEWWRSVTALTLHGDGPHLIANLACGLLFAAFLLPRLGGGLAWLAILVSGAAGNALNAWGYRGESHLSIGASTACFGALGILVGLELLDRWREPGRRHRWQLILPIGAGFALLAFLGVGEESRNVDYMAHCWGFLAGLAEGLWVAGWRLEKRLSPMAQRVAAALASTAVGGAWWLAVR